VTEQNNNLGDCEQATLAAEHRKIVKEIVNERERHRFRPVASILRARFLLSGNTSRL